MATKKSGSTFVGVDALKHSDDKRKNIPTAEYQSLMADEARKPVQVNYPRATSNADGLRLDFFGDEIETIRRFSPQDQRSIGTVDRFALLPAVETLMDEDAVRRFRTHYRDLFGTTATGDPLYQAVWV